MSKSSGFVVELGVNSVSDSLDFYVGTLGCTEIEVVSDDSGRKIWAEIDFENSRLMLQDLSLLCDEIPGISRHKTSNGFALVLRVGKKAAAKSLFMTLQEKRVPVNSGPVETDYGTYEYSILDPDSFVILIAGRD
jgi:uncharacterized glyoxalase superfamily protein PhnB